MKRDRLLCNLSYFVPIIASLFILLIQPWVVETMFVLVTINIVARMFITVMLAVWYLIAGVTQR